MEYSLSAINLMEYGARIESEVYMSVRERLNRECPPDIREQAESYCFGSLAREQTAALEAHYLGCPRCTAELQRAEAYIAAMRAAARRIAATERPTSVSAHS
jgi:hypothetical protein